MGPPLGFRHHNLPKFLQLYCHGRFYWTPTGIPTYHDNSRQRPGNNLKKGAIMAAVKQGDRVSINYIASLEDGTVFDSTYETDGCGDECETGECDTDDCGCGETGPMQLTIGAGDFFPQIEEALIGMTIGEKKTVAIPATEAFGLYDEEKVFTVPHSELPEEMSPEVGSEYVLTNDEEEEFGVTVIEVTEESVTFDANHPLAGEDLSFELELVEIL